MIEKHYKKILTTTTLQKISGKNANIVLQQENLWKIEDTVFWSKQWGEEANFSHVTSCSAGVAILLKTFRGRLFLVIG